MDPARRRRFTERAEEERKGALKDIDHVARAVRMGGFVCALLAGFFGFLGGLVLIDRAESPGALIRLAPIWMAVLGSGAAYFLYTALLGRSASFGASLYMPGGVGHSKKKREYSLAESFAVRGEYEDAVSAFQLAVAEHPEDPVPYLRIARIQRDELKNPEEAVRWFKRARGEATLPAGGDIPITRELIEVYRKMGRPLKAAPELARLADTHEGAEVAAWARKELAELKREMREE